MTPERVSRPLGRIAEILVENDARASPSEIQDLLDALDARAYQEGFEDGQWSAEDPVGSGVVCPEASPASTIGPPSAGSRVPYG
jgi:hypothetical protein